MIRIAAFQTYPKSQIEQRYAQIHNILSKADALNIDFICFPEGFLTGYYDNKALTIQNSLNIKEEPFKEFVQELQNYRSTIIIGFNEIDDTGSLYDSVAIIESGKLLGTQRKHYQYHDFCTPGLTFNTFESKGVCFGVVICLDSNYFEPSRILALQGATLLFVPSCNKVPFDNTYAHRPSYYAHFAARAHENRCWLISADWHWPFEDHLIGPGHSAIYNPNGQEVLRSKQLSEDLIINDIPDDQLSLPKGKRVHGSPFLWKTLIDFL